MESVGLSKFLDSIGNSVHAINTICIGLNEIEIGNFNKPDSLTISWTSSDKKASARKSRALAIRAILIYVKEAFQEYMKYVKNHPALDRKQKKAFEKQGLAESFEEFSKNICFPHEYWVPCVLLIIHWRNRIVHHNSNADLKYHQKKILLQQKEDLKANHANINIERTLDDFQNRKITLKDFSTLVAITIQTVRHIDKELYLSINDIDTFESYIKKLNLYDTFIKQTKANGHETNKEKYQTF